MRNSQRKERNNGYSENTYRKKLNGMPHEAGRAVVEKAVTLYVVLTDRETPFWARALVISALAYWIAPLDATPDFIPLAGYVDDLAVMALALIKLGGLVTPAMHGRVQRMLPEGMREPTRKGKPKKHETKHQERGDNTGGES